MRDTGVFNPGLVLTRGDPGFPIGGGTNPRGRGGGTLTFDFFQIFKKIA